MLVFVRARFAYTLFCTIQIYVYDDGDYRKFQLKTNGLHNGSERFLSA